MLPTFLVFFVTMYIPCNVGGGIIFLEIITCDTLDQKKGTCDTWLVNIIFLLIRNSIILTKQWDLCHHIICSSLTLCLAMRRK